MRKLNLLKAIVDFVWIMTLICIPFLLFFIGLLMFSNKPIDFPVRINGIQITVLDLTTKIVLFIASLSYGAILYGIYLMKKLLSLFQNRIIFDSNTIKYLNQIGISLVVSAVLEGISFVIYKLPEIGIEIGDSPFLYLVSLGLFFMVLSEVFKIAKTMKEENDLTL